MKIDFDNKYLIAYLCDSKTVEDFMVLLNFYRFLSNLLYKTKDYKLYQIKLQWLLEEFCTNNPTKVEEVDKFKILMNKYQFKQSDVVKMIETKAIDMDNFPFSSQEDLLKYIENTDGVFWSFYSRVLFGDSLSETEQENIINMAKAFGIIELIKFAQYKKSKNIYVFLYSQEDMKDVLKIEKQNIKSLSALAWQCVKESSKNKGKLKKLLLLNYFSKDFLKNLENADYKINTPSISNISKLTYLKIILSLIFRI